MYKQLFTSLLAFTSFCTTAQQLYFHKQWDKRFGGLKQETSSILINTNNNGFLIAGYSNSGIGGDKTQPNWDTLLVNTDYYVVKIDSGGQLQWEKRLGGIISDALWAAEQINQNEFMLGGWSDCGVTGDKTEPSRGSADYWIVKIDENGNKQWDKRFGGPGEDLFQSMQHTNDGGYILGGMSGSGIGGDKTQPSWGYDDYWVVKIDSTGNKQWDKRFGGTDADFLRTLTQTHDGGYLLVGVSGSGLNGDKTHELLDTTHNLPDIWVVKIDSSGNKEWDKSLEVAFQTQATDNYYISKTNDGGYAIGCPDYLIIKLDSLFNVSWQKFFVGGYYFSGLSVTNDNGFLLSGVSHDGIGGDKTEDNLGIEQTWIIKTDYLGNKQWDKTIFTTGNDYYGYTVQTKDGCYAVANSSRAGIGGYKTQTAWDSSYDFFIVKFCMDTVTGIKELTDQPQISVYPNPFTSDISISIQKENLREAAFTITNLVGQTIYHREETNLANSYTKMLDLSYLPTGMYLLTVTTDGYRISKQIIKQ